MQRNSDLYIFLKSINKRHLSRKEHLETYILFQNLSTQDIAPFEFISQRKKMFDNPNIKILDSFRGNIYYVPTDVFFGRFIYFHHGCTKFIGTNANTLIYTDAVNVVPTETYANPILDEIIKPYTLVYLHYDGIKANLSDGITRIYGIRDEISPIICYNANTIFVQFPLLFQRNNILSWNGGRNYHHIQSNQIKQEICETIKIFCLIHKKSQFYVPQEIRHIIYEFIVNS